MTDFRVGIPRTRAKLRMNIFAESGDRTEHIADSQMDIEINNIVYWEGYDIKSMLKSVFVC